MSKGKAQSARAEEKFDLYSKQFDDLDDFTAEVLRGFCITCAQIDMLNEEIERDGLLIEGKKGRVENPAVNVKHKLEADKARTATYLRRVLNDGGSDGPSLMDDWS